MLQVPMDGKLIQNLFSETEMNSIDDIAKFLDLSPRTLYTWISKNSIPQRHLKRLSDVVDEKRNAKLKFALDRAEIGMLIRAIEKRGFTVTLESK